MPIIIQNPQTGWWDVRFAGQTVASYRTYAEARDWMSVWKLEHQKTGDIPSIAPPPDRPELLAGFRPERPEGRPLPPKEASGRTVLPMNAGNIAMLTQLAGLSVLGAGSGGKVTSPLAEKIVEDAGLAPEAPRASPALAQAPTLQAAGNGPTFTRGRSVGEALGRFDAAYKRRRRSVLKRRRKATARREAKQERVAAMQIRHAGQVETRQRWQSSRQRPTGVFANVGRAWQTGLFGGPRMAAREFVRMRAAGAGTKAALGAGFGRLLGGVGARGGAAGLGAMVGAAGGPPGVGVGLAIGFVADAAIHAAGSLSRFGKRAEEVTKQLAYASPSQAMIEAERGIRRWQRDLTVGERTSESSRRVMEATENLTDALSGVKGTWIDLMNNFTAWGDESLLKLVNAVKSFFGAKDELGKGGVWSSGEWLDHQANVARAERANNKPGFRRLEFGTD